MDREIIFRGLTKKGEWVYGLFCPDAVFYVNGMSDAIWTNCGFVAVERSTIGQFINRHDCNGKRIFEGDVVKITSNESKEIYQVGYVVYNSNNAAFMIECKKDYYGESSFSSVNGRCFIQDKDAKNEKKIYTYEVIGNIYESKDLIQNV